MAAVDQSLNQSSLSSSFVLAEPIEETLIDKLQDLMVHRDKIAACRETVLALPQRVFVEPDGFMADLLDQMINAKTPTSTSPIAIGQPDKA